MKLDIRCLKAIGRFGNLRTSGAYIKLQIADLRAKAYTDCQGYRKHCNDPSRLELAREEPPTTD